MKHFAALLLLALSIAPTYVLASTGPDGDTHVPGTSFALIYRADNGQYIARIPSANTEEIKATCGTHRPLWLHDSSAPGRCLSVLPQRSPDDRIIELKVSFAHTDDREILLLSTHDIDHAKASFRDVSEEELTSLTHTFPDVFKDRPKRGIKVADASDTETFFFIPMAKVSDLTDDLYEPPCTRWKTQVLRQDAHGLSKAGFLDNMPTALIDARPGEAPMALTVVFCKTVATLWKIAPRTQQVASFFNGVGG